MLTLKNPKWINEFFYQYDNFERYLNMSLMK